MYECLRFYGKSAGRERRFALAVSGEDTSYSQYCDWVRIYAAITFPQFAKIDVFGENQIPLYKWLEENSKFEGFSGFMGKIVSVAAKKNDKDYKNNSKVKWNFTKFLIDKNGNLVARFEPTTKMSEVKKQVEAIL